MDCRVAFICFVVAILLKSCVVKATEDFEDWESFEVENAPVCANPAEYCAGLRTPGEMVYISGGRWSVGTDNPLIPQDGEGPKRYVDIQPFYMDVFEVTNANFHIFVKETHHKTDAEIFKTSFVPEYFLDRETNAEIVQAVDGAPWWLPVRGATWHRPEGLRGQSVATRGLNPVVHVSWSDAVSYCAWKGRRLPTEEEWEIACKGGNDDAIFPWDGDSDITPGNMWRANIWQGIFPHSNTQADGAAGIAMVGSYPSNGYGLHDMAGNVWEWVNRTMPNGDKLKKGGSLMCSRKSCFRYRCQARSPGSIDTSAYNLGFRCAKDAS